MRQPCMTLARRPGACVRLRQNARALVRQKQSDAPEALEQSQKKVLAVLRRLAAKGVAHAVFLSDGTRTRERT